MYLGPVSVGSGSMKEFPEGSSIEIVKGTLRSFIMRCNFSTMGWRVP